MLRRTATWLANRDTLPTTVRAVFGFYGDTGTFDVGSIRLKRRVDAKTEAMIRSAFEAIEASLADEFGRDSVSFGYDTKLVLPAQLALGYLYRRVDDHDRRHLAEDLTCLAIEALLDGDMRDARNDAEYDDFTVDFPTDSSDKATIAGIAQATLEDRVHTRFDAFDDTVREAYDWAVDVSEAHQADDERFREMLAAAQSGDAAALDSIREQYRDADFAETPPSLSSEDCTLPYARTQYDRVGIIYDGMLRMYESAGFDIDPAFKRSIVLAIVGAQVWLDDVDDYQADRREGQLTPVTAEYVLADDPSSARQRVIDVAESYLNQAKVAARDANSPLTGIATEYIYRSGTPENLPRESATPR